MQINLFHNRTQINWYALNLVVFEGRTVMCLDTIRDICMRFLRMIILRVFVSKKVVIMYQCVRLLISDT